MCARRSQSPFAAPSTPLALLQLENDCCTPTALLSSG